MGRRRLPLLVGTATLVAAVPVAAARSVPASPLENRARAQLALFTDWLAQGKAKGLIGEVGWPGNPQAGGDPRWNDVARAFYAQAEAKGLWVSAWAAGEIWQSSYKLLVYGAPRQYGPVSAANPQAAVVESRRLPRLRGVNVEQGAFGELGSGYDPIAPTSPLHNRNPGEHGRIYAYPGAETYRYLAGRSVGFVRLPFRWERVQRRPSAPLDATELARLETSLDAAAAAGLKVILDCHNYGAYYLFDGSTGRRRAIGSRQLSQAAFADLWRRLALALGGHPAVLGYGLMNEPVGLPGGARTWESASRRAVAAIRATGDRRRIFVQSYDWGGLWQYPRHHARGPWIADPAGNTWYEAHAYFDRDSSGRYAASFDEEAAYARRQGY